MCGFRWCGRQLCLRNMPISGVNATPRPTAVYASDPALPRRPQTRSRPACSALNGPDFHWQAHSSFLSHPAPGSCRRSNVIASGAFSSARNLDPCAPRFGGMPIPVLCPGLAWRSTLPPAAPLPSTPSATAHTLSPRAITVLFGCFIGTTSASNSSPVPRQITLWLAVAVRDRLSDCGPDEVSQVPTRSLCA